MTETPETPEAAEPEEGDAGSGDAVEQATDIENDPAYNPDDEGLKDIKGA